MADKDRSHSGGSQIHSNGEKVLPKSSFVTTSDVLNQLNRQLSDLTTYDSNGSRQQQEKPRFELQKRLPDGSTIPATKDEIAAADFKTKLEQSAKFVSELKSPEDRQAWTEAQRLIGNSLFQHGDYKAAMDVYLTCLVVKENTPDFIRDTFLPVLNNLAQCTLQLGMHMKTILFCEMALEEVSKAKEKGGIGKESDEEGKTEQSELSMKKELRDAIALCKIFFKLGKAFRLTGHYRKAREALHNSLDCLIGEENEVIASLLQKSGNDDAPPFSLDPYKKAIKKEFLYLDVAEKEAARNSARQKLAMQKILSLSATTKSKSSVTQGENKTLYDKASEVRQFSKLRVRKGQTSLSTFQRDPGTDSHGDCQSESRSYSEYYWSMVSRVAKKLLVILGDQNEDMDNDRLLKTEATNTRMGKKQL